MSEEKKKRKNPSGVNTHEDTDANGELDSPAADEPAANEGTSSPAPPPKKKSSLKPRMEREAELLNAIQALQGRVEVLQNDLAKASRIPKKAALAPVESSSSDEGGTVALEDIDSDPGAFDYNVNPEDGKSSTLTSRPHRRATPTTPNTSVMGITNDRMVNIHFGQNRRGSLESAKFTAEQMQQFINELDGAYRSNRYVVRDTILCLTATAARNLITYDMLAHQMVTVATKEEWLNWDAERLVETLRKVYPAETTTRFQPTDTRWAEVGSRVNSIEAIRLSDPLGPTNNVRGKFLVTLVQSLAELGEPKPDQIDTLLRDMIKGLVAPTNEHRSKEGNVRMKELLEKRVLEARATSTNSARRVSMESFIGILSGLLAEIEQHHTLSATYGLVPRSTASSNKDSNKSKQGGSKSGAKDSTSTICSGCGGTYHSFDKCFFKEHPDFNKSGTWEKSTALAKLKAKFPDDESCHRLNRSLESMARHSKSPSSSLKRAESLRARKVRKYQLTMMRLPHTW